MPEKSKAISTTKLQALVTPAPLPPHVDHELRVCISRLVPPIEPGRSRYEITADAAPRPAVRQALELRKARLDDAMRPAGPEIVADELDRMIDAGMQMRGDEPGAMTRWAAGAAQDLMDLPAFALAAACQDLRRGVVGDGKWLPEVGVIRSTAHLKVYGLAKEKREIETVLGAEIKFSALDLGRKAELLATARKLGASMSMYDAVERARQAGRDVKVDEIPDAALSPDARRAKHAAHAESFKGRSMPPMGPLLRRSLEQAGVIAPENFDDQQHSEVA